MIRKAKVWTGEFSDWLRAWFGLLGLLLDWRRPPAAPPGTDLPPLKGLEGRWGMVVGLIEDAGLRGWLAEAFQALGRSYYLCPGPELVLNWRAPPTLVVLDDRWRDIAHDVKQVFPLAARVLLTGDGDMDLRDRIVELGFHDYAVRPLTRPLLERILAKLELPAAKANGDPQRSDERAPQPRPAERPLRNFIDKARELLRVYDKSKAHVSFDQFAKANGMSRSALADEIALARGIDDRCDQLVRQHPGLFQKAKSWFLAMRKLDADTRYALCLELVERYRNGEKFSLAYVRQRVAELRPNGREGGSNGQGAEGDGRGGTVPPAAAGSGDGSRPVVPGPDGDSVDAGKNSGNAEGA